MCPVLLPRRRDSNPRNLPGNLFRRTEPELHARLTGRNKLHRADYMETPHTVGDHGCQLGSGDVN